MGILDIIDKRAAAVKSNAQGISSSKKSLERFDADLFVKDHYTSVLKALRVIGHERGGVVAFRRSIEKVLRSAMISVDVKDIEISKLSADDLLKLGEMFDTIRTRQEPLNPFDADGHLSETGLRQFYRERITLAAKEVGISVDAREGKELVDQLAGLYADRLLQALHDEDLEAARKAAGEVYPTDAIPAAVEALPEATDLVAWVEEYYGLWVKLGLMDTGEIDRFHPVLKPDASLSRRIGLQLSNKSRSKRPPQYAFAQVNPPSKTTDIFHQISACQKLRLNHVPEERLGAEHDELRKRVFAHERAQEWKVKQK